MPEHSRSRLQSWIRSGALTVNGEARRPKDKVMLSDRLELDAEPEAQVTWQAEAISLDIVYEDEHLLVINKPAGLVVHPAAGHADGTLVNALLNYAPEVENLPRAGIVHRLDKDTSGIMVVARSLVAHTSLVGQLQTRTMGREYEAVVVGTLTGGATVDAPIGRHPHERKKMGVVKNGKPALWWPVALAERYNGGVAGSAFGISSAGTACTSAHAGASGNRRDSELGRAITRRLHGITRGFA